jgi:hypothetical protein
MAAAGRNWFAGLAALAAVMIDGVGPGYAHVHGWLAPVDAWVRH